MKLSVRILLGILLLLPAAVSAQERTVDTGSVDSDEALPSLPGGPPSVVIRPYTEGDRWKGKRHALEVEVFRLLDYFNLGYSYTFNQYLSAGLRLHTTPAPSGGDPDLDGRILTGELAIHPAGLQSIGGLRVSLGLQAFRGSRIQNDWDRDTTVSRSFAGESLYFTFGFIMPVLGDRLYSTVELGGAYTIDMRREEGAYREEIPWVTPLFEMSDDWSATAILRFGYRIL